jgi:hypothetical protein
MNTGEEQYREPVLDLVRVRDGVAIINNIKNI